MLAKTLIIMAGGIGSRFGGDKQLSGLGPSGETLMEYSVYDALKAGFERIVIVVRPGMEGVLAPMLEGMAAKHPSAEFICVGQELENSEEFRLIHPLRTKPLGTVHALLSAARYIDGSFAVINADDFYGRPAFESIAECMDGFENTGDAAIVVYSLRNTLSNHGAVTRGICGIEDGYLSNIREAYKVMSTKEQGTVELVEDKYFPLDDKSAVSMNFWAFHEGMLPHFRAYFEDFLHELQHGDNKSECLLPVMAQHFIQRKMLRVKALYTQSVWFGLTYLEDAEEAAWELDKRHADGTYPQRLF